MLEPELTTREATATRSPRAAPESSLHPLHPKTSTHRDEDPVQPKKKKKIQGTDPAGKAVSVFRRDNWGKLS